MFYRTRYGVEFTAEGEKIFNDIEYSMKILENVPKNLENLNNILNTLNFASSFGSARMLIIPHIPSILKKYPDLKIVVDKYENDKIIEALLNNSADIAIIDENTQRTDNIMYYESINVDRILIASPKFINEHKIKKITKDNFTKFPFISTGKTSSTKKILDEYLDENCISLNPKIDVDSYEMVLDLILQGFGMAFFNKPYIKKFLQSGELVEIPSDIKVPTKTLYIAINKNNMNNQNLKSIIKILLDE